MFRSEDWDLVHQTLSANRSGSIIDVCERVIPFLCCCCSYYTCLNIALLSPPICRFLVWAFILIWLSISQSQFSSHLSAKDQLILEARETGLRKPIHQLLCWLEHHLYLSINP